MYRELLLLVIICSCQCQGYFRDIESAQQPHPFLLLRPVTSRRSGGKSMSRIVASPSPNPNDGVHWCRISAECKLTSKTAKKIVCGFDEKYGYGKFDDACHMLQVNCYWRYSFQLLKSCNEYE